ncbi:MAG: DUF2914 domain-containing protein [Candidatus Neomarinimicrobiota bacterium]|nr:DUF2914 domain-containing protein [Candidatus Neomarinimicrobiota bacterium]
MDSTFIVISIVFIIFIIIANYLKVLRLSIPLVIIYCIFCFNYLIDNENNYSNPSKKINKQNIDKPKYNSITKLHEPIENKNKTSIVEKQIINNVVLPKPILSYTPKPIMIDSNVNISEGTNINKITPKLIVTDDFNNVKNIKQNSDLNTLKLNEIMICRGIYKRNPIKPGINFINSVDSLFCYTKISNSGPKQEIKHIWYLEGIVMTSVAYNIKPSFNYRSWSRKTIYPNQTGQWRVDVIDSYGNILGTRDFTIKSISSTY